MPYQTSLPGMGQAVRRRLKALIIAGLTDLNTQLTAQGSPLSLITAVSGQVHRGDFNTLPDPAANPFWITIISGGREDGRSTGVQRKQSGPGYWYTYYTNIFAYIHPQSFPGSDVGVQAEAREDLRAVLEDWLVTDIFNNATNVNIVLTSQHMTPGTYDHITEAMVTAATAGLSAKSFGQSQLIEMLHLTHEGKVYGGY